MVVNTYKIKTMLLCYRLEGPRFLLSIFKIFLSNVLLHFPSKLIHYIKMVLIMFLDCFFFFIFLRFYYFSYSLDKKKRGAPLIPPVPITFVLDPIRSVCQMHKRLAKM